MINENKLIWDRFITESPWLTQPISDEYNDRMLNIPIRTLKNLKLVDTFDNMDIHSVSNELYFVSETELIAYYKYNIDDTGMCQTKMVWNNPKHKGIFLKIFGGYIIPKFKVVQSDDMMTAKAFSMWQKLIGHYTEFTYYVKDGEELIKIDNPYDVHNYKEKISFSDKGNTTFIVTVDK